MLFLFLAIFISAVPRLAFAHKNHPHRQEHNVVASPTTAKEEISRFASINESYQNAIKPIFMRSCFHCHSQSPNLPWYHALPIVNGMIEGDMKEAKEHLDFSLGFPFQGHGAPKEDLEALADSVRDGSMPPLRYRLMHWSSSLSQEERVAILAWIDKSLKILTDSGSSVGNR